MFILQLQINIAIHGSCVLFFDLNSAIGPLQKFGTVEEDATVLVIPTGI